MSETVGEWKERKEAQGLRLIEKFPGWKIDSWFDYGTKFVLVNFDEAKDIVFGQLPRNGIMQPSIDLSDDEVEALIEPQEAT